jgi:hypothetical protein
MKDITGNIIRENHELVAKQIKETVDDLMKHVQNLKKIYFNQALEDMGSPPPDWVLRNLIQYSLPNFSPNFLNALIKSDSKTAYSVYIDEHVECHCRKCTKDSKTNTVQQTLHYEELK